MSSFKLGAAGDNQQVQVEQIQILEDRLEHLERICHGGHCHGEQGGSILLEEDLFSTVSRLHNQWLQMLQTQLPLADFIRKCKERKKEEKGWIGLGWMDRFTDQMYRP